jgi:hypothetical protein
MTGKDLAADQTLGDFPPSDYTGCGTCGTFSAKCQRDDCPYTPRCPEAWDRVTDEAMKLIQGEK